MDQDARVLCCASKYAQKYYLNPEFGNLPEQVKQELQILAVSFTEDVGGIIMFAYDEDGNLGIMTEKDEGDLFYDEIGAELLISRMQREKKELFEQLEEYYREFFLK